MSLDALEAKVEALNQSIKQLQHVEEARREDRGKIYERLRTLEATVSHMPKSEEMRVLLNMADAYRLKKQFWSKMADTLASKGLLALIPLLGLTFWDNILAALKALKGGG